MIEPRPRFDASDEVAALRQSLHESRSEAESLRLDLAEAQGFVEALEAELWAVTVASQPLQDGRVTGAEIINLLLQARSLIRRTSFQQMGPAGDRTASLRDLRIAEVSFRFLLDLHASSRKAAQE